MKKTLLLSIAIFLLAAGCKNSPINYVPPHNTTTPPGNGEVACSMDAKLCPDGSYVARSGPNCEFAACPQPKPTTTPPTSTTRGVVGQVLLGPTCPVQRIPPDPACADKGYSAAMVVKSADGQTTITNFTSAGDGSFKINLAPGDYLLVPQITGIFPRGQSVTVTVQANKYTSTNIYFDTGIR